MDTTIDIQPMVGNMNEQADISIAKAKPEKNMPAPNKRGRPKGARTTTLAEVRKQAAEEKNRLKLEMGNQIRALQNELTELKRLYEEDTGRLAEELEILKRREGNYQQALGERLQEVATHLQTTLLSWGAAELEEAQVDKRGRGRPRKTLK